jgi:DNA-binding NtrC family response regulator
VSVARVPRGRILVVEDDEIVREAIRSFLEHEGYVVDEAASCSEAERALSAQRPDLALADYRLPDGDALELVARLKATDASPPVMILTSHGSIDLAVRAVKAGAENFLTKPIELPLLATMVERILENQRSRKRELARKQRRAREPLNPFAGTSAAIQRLHDDARRVLASDAPVLLVGETGTGKGVLARWLHEKGPRVEEPFVDINCGGLSRELLESELFGHERGAFTGAVGAKPGLFEIAHRGTIFLDEIGDIALELQPRLLKAVEERRFRRVGDVRDREVDVRLVSATLHDLSRLVREGRFRSDLYYRVATIVLVLPPLRERSEDVPELSRILVRALAAEMGRPEPELTPAALEALEVSPWPGNLRELKNVLENALLFGASGVLDERDLRIRAPETAEPRETLTLLELEKRAIARALSEESGHVDAAARRLGVPRSTLYAKLARYGIPASRT